MSLSDALRAPLQFEPAFKERVWGGRQLLPGSDQLIGEAWILHEDQPVVAGPFAGRTLADLTCEYPAQLLGEGHVAARKAGRFPLLLKLLDCQDWLSVQVHPDDQQAREMVGPDENGKTEAWHILRAEPGAKLISGTRAGVTDEQVRQAILSANVSGVTQESAVHAGETLMVPAGTLHALGPGLLIYEIQQTSDTTYRVYDWDRPASAGRELHLEQSAQVTQPGQAKFTPAHPPQPGATDQLAECEFFRLEQLQGDAAHPVGGDTARQGFHVLTVKSGEARLSTAAGELTLRPYDTVLLPAALGAYELRGTFEILRGQQS
ncbi:type I phosphomannose isomerase catalytic subunit [Deinococcus sp.]|uniref:type I phosphomannose isomerase catalytic subunit n=1 Tax=Deinococcus sp. TaxID=47478 RepID=UPI0025C3744B|nr:type I phosphomannose isomerase catalytic subunit [Deinococcus sp.]